MRIINDVEFPTGKPFRVDTGESLAAVIGTYRNLSELETALMPMARVKNDIISLAVVTVDHHFTDSDAFTATLHIIGSPEKGYSLAQKLAQDQYQGLAHITLIQ